MTHNDSRRDPYAVLGLSRGVAAEEIRAAYRRRAMETHPDRNGGKREAFDEVQQAYDALRSSLQGEDNAAQTVSKPVASAFDTFFDAMDRHDRKATPRSATEVRNGSDLAIEITLEEAYAGGVVHVVRAGGTCEVCHGEGRVRSQRPQACSECGGAGHVIAAKGFITVRSECGACEGTGRSRIVICTGCGGTGGGGGFEMDVVIPQGCRDGYRITPDGMRGMQFIVKIKPHALYRRDIVDLAMVMTLPVSDAVLGTTVTIEGIDGDPLDVVIPPGCWSGDDIRIEGRGMPAFSGRGDVLVRIEIMRPPHDERVLKLFDGLRELGLQQPLLQPKL